LNLAGHELAHNLFFDKPVHNTLFGFVANLPMPLAITVYVHTAAPDFKFPTLPLDLPFHVFFPSMATGQQSLSTKPMRNNPKQLIAPVTCRFRLHEKPVSLVGVLTVFG
jgi:hypothetical protein